MPIKIPVRSPKLVVLNDIRGFAVSADRLGTSSVPNGPNGHRFTVILSRRNEEFQAVPFQTIIASTIVLDSGGLLQMISGEQSHKFPAGTWDSFEVKHNNA
jgi:hypothetical protein